MAATDPRKLGGSIAGPGGPFDRGAVVIDTDHAVLFEDMTVAAVEAHRHGASGETLIAMLLSGRVNHTPDHADVLFLFDVDGAAAIITELVDLADRMGISATLRAAVKDRFDQLDREVGRP